MTINDSDPQLRSEITNVFALGSLSHDELDGITQIVVATTQDKTDAEESCIDLVGLLPFFCFGLLVLWNLDPKKAICAIWNRLLSNPGFA